MAHKLLVLIRLNPMAAAFNPDKFCPGEQGCDFFLVLLLEELGVITSNKQGLAIKGRALGKSGKGHGHCRVGNNGVNVEPP